MSQAVVMSTNEWRMIYEQIKLDHPPSVYLIREKMKKVMGFTVRVHHDHEWKRERSPSVHLDFYTESLKTMFILKYQSYH